jgi:rhodanese-related sulfurtransferase
MRYWNLLILITAFFTGIARAQSVNADEFEKGISNQQVQVLDVRTSGEFNSGYLKNALQADWTNQDQFHDRVQYVDRDKPVYIYCLGGSRSAAAATWMRTNGFKKVVELQGGINAWKKAGKPVEGVANEKQMSSAEYWSTIKGNKTVLVDFGASWCPPCVKMKPVIDELVKEKGNSFRLFAVDGGVNTDVMKEMNVDALPVFIIYKDGKEIWRKQGPVAKSELLEELEK